MKKIKILAVVGTRPEVIKVAPLIMAAKEFSEIDLRLCVTSQQRELQNEALSLFKIKAEYDLDIMVPNQDLYHITEKVLSGLKTILDEFQPNYIVIQGDTTTAFAASLAGFYNKIKVAHLEAGLRTYDKYSPFPEEVNRQLISRIADLHFAPTHKAVSYLKKEGIKKGIYKVGNTIVDSVTWGVSNFKSNLKYLNRDLKKVLITVHRRENFGQPLLEICQAVLELSQLYPEIKFIWPVHPNPNVKNVVNSKLKGIANVILEEPLLYSDLLMLINQSDVILSDSGGIQEESCILGKKIIILRNDTERPEVVESGFGKLAGSDIKKIRDMFIIAIRSSKKSKVKNLYGEEGVSKKILNIIIRDFSYA